MRERVLERLSKDLVGPYEEDEVLTSRPSDVYLTGILWPRDSRMGAEEDERLGLSASGEDETSGAGEEEEVSLVGLKRPCSAGISFAASSENISPIININIKFAIYNPVERTVDVEESRTLRPQIEWHRQAYDVDVGNIILDQDSRFVKLSEFGAPPDVKLYVRATNWSQGMLGTVSVLNYLIPEDDEGRNGVERCTMFQVRLEIRPGKGTALVSRPSRRAIVDDDDRSAALLYRNAQEFAVGHTCSAEWVQDIETEPAEMLATTWIPKTTVPATSAMGDSVFERLRMPESGSPLSALWIFNASQNMLGEALLELPGAYREWIENQTELIASIPDEFQNQARDNIATCRNVQERMESGARRIADDYAMNKAFRLANLAMSMQYSWNSDTPEQGSLEWRPFQMGFILLTAASVAERVHPERRIMDLLWFPTGGGKTEAYLGLIAFLSFYRRLVCEDDEKAGVTAIMRYTLRLLTTQQFSRAAAVILACEAIRRGRVSEAGRVIGLGKTPFSIGLWVGGDAVPNKVRDAAAALGGAPDQPTPQQLVNCPACGESLYWFYNEQASAIHVRCPNDNCILYHPTTPLPVWTVDEDVYNIKPTLLIGTIDKFAQIVRRKEINRLFGLDIGQPPDLIIQDELHLISGPLGTVAGLYEVAIDRMFMANGAPPKVIGSTATIRRATDQVMALFNRETSQFPPSCIDAQNSGFAVIDREAPGRIYAGVTTAGRSAKFTLQAVAASLMQSALNASGDDATRDPYWTLVSYFNSLRELGGALVLMQDDVNDSIATLAARREESVRRPELIEELTSRRTQAEVRDMLAQLEVSKGRQGALDVVLATNMLSVGIDIPRLGLMLVNGQPKGIAEYIQATSRVGRGEVAGLVVTVLNNAKARDRSHYENFSTWHAALYRDVEPTSVTPFASRARDRALHSVLVALVRHLVPGMLDRPVLDDRSIDEAGLLIEDIVQRSDIIDRDETAVRFELESLLERWIQRSPQSYWSRRRDSLLQDAERAATLRAMGRLPGDSWPTLNNMRSVEVSTRFRLAEFLRPRTDEGEKDG